MNSKFKKFIKINKKRMIEEQIENVFNPFLSFFDGEDKVLVLKILYFIYNISNFLPVFLNFFIYGIIIKLGINFSISIIFIHLYIFLFIYYKMKSKEFIDLKMYVNILNSSIDTKSKFFFYYFRYFFISEIIAKVIAPFLCFIFIYKLSYYLVFYNFIISIIVLICNILIFFKKTLRLKLMFFIRQKKFIYFLQKVEVDIYNIFSYKHITNFQLSF